MILFQIVKFETIYTVEDKPEKVLFVGEAEWMEALKGVGGERNVTQHQDRDIYTYIYNFKDKD
jgi:hypothetical protein